MLQIKGGHATQAGRRYLERSPYVISDELAPALYNNLQNAIKDLNIQRAITELTVDACLSDLPRLPAIMGKLVSLRSCDFSLCQALEYLPESIGCLGALQVLKLAGCSQLRKLPTSIGQLNSLQTLNLAGCRKLRQLPESIGNLGNLQMLNLVECRGLDLPDLSRCIELESFGHVESVLLHAPKSLSSSIVSFIPDELAFHIRFHCWKISRVLDKVIPTRLAQALTGLHAVLAFWFLALWNKALQSRVLSIFEGAFIGLYSPFLFILSIINLLFVPWQHQRDLVRVPLDHLPRRLQNKQPRALLDIDKVQKSLEALSWISILLATASFVGFIAVPASYYEDTGLVKTFLHPPPPPPPPPSPGPLPAPAPAPLSEAMAIPGQAPDINRSSLRSYFICNVVTFFLSFATTLFCVTENMPDSSLPTANEVFVTLAFASTLFVLSIIAGACTFLSGVFTVYPRSMLRDMIFPTVAAGAFLLVVLIRHVIHLFYLLVYAHRWRYYLGSHVQVTFPAKDGKEKTD